MSRVLIIVTGDCNRSDLMSALTETRLPEPEIVVLGRDTTPEPVIEMGSVLEMRYVEADDFAHLPSLNCKTWEQPRRHNNYKSRRRK